MVERTIGWMTRWCQRVRAYERRIDVSEAMIYVVMSKLAAPPPPRLIRFQTDSKQAAPQPADAPTGGRTAETHR